MGLGSKTQHFSLIYLFIHFPSLSQPPPTSLPRPTLRPPPSPLPYTPHFPSLRRRRVTIPPPPYQPALEHWVASGLKESSSGEADQGGPAKGKGSEGKQQHLSQRQPLLQLLKDSHENQATHLIYMCRGPRSSLWMLFGWWFNL